MSHTAEDLLELQAKTLEEKIQISTARIIEWHEHWGGACATSNSGGVDSTVLSDLVHRVYPDVPDVYCDTGLEYPELRDFVLKRPRIEILHPQTYNRKTRCYERMSFVDIIKQYGYPLISKEQSRFIWDMYNSKSDKLKKVRIEGNGGRFKIREKWKIFLEPSCDIRIGDHCCGVMKKMPTDRYTRETGRYLYVGTMTEESMLRMSDWLKHGCNSFDGKKKVSKPLSFWTKSDVLEYLLKFNVPYCKEVYGEIVLDEHGKYTTTKRKRTGCVFCGYGCHLEKEPNRFQQLAVSHPQLYDYCMRGGKYDEQGIWQPDKGLGMAKVLDFINVKWWNDGDEAKRDEYRVAYKQKELNR